MKKRFLRGSWDIESDLVKGHSYHTTPFNTIDEALEEYPDNEFEILTNADGVKSVCMVLDGLCCLALEDDDLADIKSTTAYESILNWYDEEHIYLIEGEYSGDCWDGDLVINATLVKKII